MVRERLSHGQDVPLTWLGVLWSSLLADIYRHFFFLHGWLNFPVLLALAKWLFSVQWNGIGSDMCYFLAWPVQISCEWCLDLFLHWLTAKAIQGFSSYSLPNIGYYVRERTSVLRHWDLGFSLRQHLASMIRNAEFWVYIRSCSLDILSEVSKLWKLPSCLAGNLHPPPPGCGKARILSDF